MTKKRILLLSSFALLFIVAVAVGLRYDIMNERADKEQISELVDKYVQTINNDDLELVEDIWSHEDYASFIGPSGRYAGYESIRDDFVHGVFGVNFKERHLQKEDLQIHVNGENAWAEFTWRFDAIRNDGSSHNTRGRETQVFEKDKDGWKLVHVHYSALPVNRDHSVKLIPDNYYQEAEQQGEVVMLEYQTKLYDTNEQITKYCYVYLPYGYEENGDQRYDILYFMHGGGSTAEKFLGGNDSISLNRKNLDHMIQDKRIKPMIVVTPSFYRNDIKEETEQNAGDLVKLFPRELTEDLMPAVEGRYRTYAQSTSAEDLQAAREHRAFSGFSMGGVTTWWVFAKAMDYFKYFMPLSGDSWIVQTLGGSQASEATAKALSDAVNNTRWKQHDFFVFALTGSEDMAEKSLTPQLEAMKSQPAFNFNGNFFSGNLYYSVLEGGKHESSTFAPHYLFTALPEFFGN